MQDPPSSGARVPLGFSFSGIAAGIKVRRRDLGLIFSEVPAVAAGCFTTSSARAASVRRAARLLPRAGVRAILVASGNANAACGPQAAGDDEAIAEAVARAIDVPADTVMTAATGVIGVPFPVQKVTGAAEALVASLVPEPGGFAEAILTTDTRTKLARRELFMAGKRVRLLGIAKGSGMVHPRMATVLGFVVTDASIAPAALAEALRTACDESFGMVSIDRATSTNDAVIALANGLSGGRPIDAAASDPGRAFTAALADLCRELARDVARDGEGATRLVTARVRGAAARAVARGLARSVIESNLVKTALFAADPGCGRILAALGAGAAECGVDLALDAVDVAIQGVALVTGGRPEPVDGDALRAKLRSDEVRIDVRVGEGAHEATAWGCDLSYDYVRINADYAAVLVDGPGGAVRRDQRLETKTPELKTEVLVSALRFIERFTGTRAVIRTGRATIERRDLSARLAEDVRLLAAVGLRPILVQAGASEALVTALAQAGVRAVGLSGADGHLLTLGDAPDGFTVDPDVVETLLAKGYVPVVVPEITEALEQAPSRAPSVDRVAAEISVACSARKLIYLTEAPGLVVEGMLVSELTAEELRARLASGPLDASARSLAAGSVRALEGGVDSVHWIDERVPHVVVAELFTESGVGTMIRVG
jgi:acetylglutamate kinase